MASRTQIVALGIAVASGVAGHAPLLAQTRLQTGTVDAILTGVLTDETGTARAHAEVQACSATLCLYSETDAGGGFRFELPRRAAPFVLKTPEDLSETPRRAAALAPIPLSGRSSLDMGPVYVSHLPGGRPLRSAGLASHDMEVGDGLQVTVTSRDLVPPVGKALTVLAARRIRPEHVPRYELPAGEVVIAVYAIHPFGATSRSPIAVRAPSTLPPGTPVLFRTIRDIDGTFSEPVPGRATGTHVVTDATRGIAALTHLVITSASRDGAAARGSSR
jgi:hypothetical protein